MKPAPPDTSAGSPLFKFLSEFKPNRLYSMVDVRVMTQGLKLFEAAAISRFRWAEQGEILDVEFGRLMNPQQVCMALEGRRFLVTCSCGQKSSCQHVVAALMSVARILREAKFSGRAFPRGYWEDLKEKLMEAASLDTSGVIDNGDKSGPPAILIASDADGNLQLRTRFAGVPLSQIGVPEDLATLLYDPDDNSVSEKDLREWWKIAQGAGDYTLEIALENSREKVRSGEVQTVAAFVVFDGNGGSVKATCGVRLGDGVEHTRLIRLGEHLIFLPEKGALAWVENPEGWNFVESMTGRRRLDAQASLGRGGLRERVPLVFKPWQFNELMIHFSEKEAGGIFSSQLRCVPSAGEDGRPPEEEVHFSIELRYEADGGMTFQIHAQTPDGTDLPGPRQVVEDVAEAVESLGNDDPECFDCAMLAVWTCLLADDPVKVLNDFRGEPSLSDALYYQHLRAVALETREEIRTRGGWFLQYIEGSEAPWRLIGNYYRRCAQAVAVLGSVLEGSGEWNFFHRLSLFELMEEWIDPAVLLRIAALCRENDIPFTCNGRPVEAAEIDISVEIVQADRAGEKGEVIDWFELHPGVVVNGFRIPADRWVELIEGRLLPSEGEGSAMLVVSEADAVKLRRLHSFYERAQAEHGGRDCGSGEDPLVPRMQILDWMSLENSGVRLELPEEDRAVLDRLRAFEKMPAAAELAEGLQVELRAYQKQGYSWLAFLYEHRFGAVLADDMGLGKTLQSIALLAAIAEGKVARKNPKVTTHLIVLPPTLVFNWTAEIAKFFPRLKVYEYIGSRRDGDVIPAADVVVTTYELARRDINKLKEIPFDVVIFDEAQAVKNYSGARSKAVRKLNAAFRLVLTGTPMENHIGEYFSVVELALPGLLGDRKTFIRESKNDTNCVQLQRARPFVLRRTKEKILKELPEKVQSDVYLDLGKTQREIYTRTVAEVRQEVAEAFKDKPKQQASIVALSALTRLRQVCISPAILDPDYKDRSPKLEHLATSLAELQREGNAALVFSQFTTVLDLVEETLIADKTKYLRLDGSTPTEDRRKLVEDFQSGDGPGIFLISLKAGGAGLNLTRASYVFHLDPWWNPAVENQASDRAHRMGQKQTVFVNRLLMRHTIEEKMMELKKRKQDLYDQIMEGAEAKADRPAGSLITRDDMDFLLTV